MGFACREHLTQKVIEYAFAGDGTVTVRLYEQADSFHCDYCNGKAVFVVMYDAERPKSVPDVTFDKEPEFM